MRLTEEQKKIEFEKIYFLHADTLYNRALGLTRNPEKAEDLVQDTCLRAFRFFDKFELGTNARAWLLKIMENLFIQEYRKDKKQELVSFNEWDFPIEPEADSLAKNGVTDEVQRALNQLPSYYRRLVIFVDMQGHNYTEAVVELGVEMGTVMSRLSRGRGLLRTYLRQYAEDRGYLVAPKSIKKQEL